MILLDLPELTLERRKRRPRRLGDVQRTRVVARFSRANTVGLFRRQAMSARASISTGRLKRKLTSFGSIRKLKTFSLVCLSCLAFCMSYKLPQYACSALLRPQLAGMRPSRSLEEAD